MTTQYQEESINGQPAPLSLILTVPTAALVAGAAPNAAAVFFPSAEADAVIVGTGIGIGGSAASGTQFEISQPGLFIASLQGVDTGLSASPFNILRGVAIGTIAPPLYPAIDFVGAPSPGIIAVGETIGPGDTLTAPFKVSATLRITDADLVDPAGGVNPDRQITFSTIAPVLAAMPLPFIQVAITRISR